MQPNYLYELQYAPTDADFSKLWAFENSGQSVNGTTGTAGADTDWKLAADISTGSVSTVTGSIVAIIDDGVAYGHAELSANMWNGLSCKDYNGNVLGGCIHGYDFWNADLDPRPAFGDSHGTHIAGTIAATMNAA